MLTFSELPIGTHFTISAANPDGTPCVKASYVAKDDPQYGHYYYAGDRSYCYLIKHDCQVTALLYPWQIEAMA